VFGGIDLLKASPRTLSDLRGREISILRAMGATRAQIRTIFMLEGMIVGVVGTVLGAVLGLGGCWALERWKFPLDTNVYFVDSLPVVIDPTAVVTIVIGALVKRYKAAALITLLLGVLIFISMLASATAGLLDLHAKWESGHFAAELALRTPCGGGH
jgi:predicted lysophospholipase L1 biosynthesis ABC-type transport system permease subunit